VTDDDERRTNHALRKRIDKLIDRVHDARAEIVEKGLDAVHDDSERGGTAGGDDPEAPPDAGSADSRP
jgi:hypothetical protein